MGALPHRTYTHLSQPASPATPHCKQGHTTSQPRSWRQPIQPFTQGILSWQSTPQTHGKPLPKSGCRSFAPRTASPRAPCRPQQNALANPPAAGAPKKVNSLSPGEPTPSPAPPGARSRPPGRRAPRPAAAAAEGAPRREEQQLFPAPGGPPAPPTPTPPAPAPRGRGGSARRAPRSRPAAPRSRQAGGRARRSCRPAGSGGPTWTEPQSG